MTRSPRVLFVTYGGGHVGMVLPVIRALEAQLPGVDCQLMALTTGHRKASAVRPTLGYRNFLQLVDADAASAWGLRLSEGNTSPDVPTDETIAYLGINYLDLIAQHGEAGAAHMYREQGRYGFHPGHFLGRVIDELKPDAVVATNSPRSEQAALEAAHERGIPSVGMVDLFGLDSDTYVMRETKPDWTCVISDVVRQRLLARGFPADGVMVTGNPAFDGLLSAEAAAQARQWVTRLGWQGLRTVLWAGHKEFTRENGQTDKSGHDFALEVEVKLRQLVRQRPDLALIVRYHPSEWHTFPRLVDEPRVHFSVPSIDPIHSAILASEVVVVQNSTVGLESAVAGRSVISLEHAPSIASSFSLADMGVSRACHANHQLPELIEQALSRLPKDTLQYRSDGLAAARVAAIIGRTLP